MSNKKPTPEAVALPQPAMTDAAEMLWIVLANVSGGDWTKQSPEWQEAAARWRDYYFAALNALPAVPSAPGDTKEDVDARGTPATNPSTGSTASEDEGL